MKKNYINLFDVLLEKGDLGLVEYLKNSSEEDLKSISRYYSVPRKIKDRDKIIIEVLGVLERTLNIGYVFDDSKKTELVKLYKCD